MFDTPLHRKNANHAKKLVLEAIDNEKRNKTFMRNEDPLPEDNTITNLIGYEKSYKKQVPIIASGRPTMEMAEKMRAPRAPKKPMKSNLGLIFQDQLTNFKGGSGERDEMMETDRNYDERALGAGMIDEKALSADVKGNEMRRQLGGAKSGKARKSKKNIVEEIETKEPSMSPKKSPMKAEMEEPKKKSRGRPRKNKPMPEEAKPMEKAPKGTKLKARAAKVKEIMKEKSLSMIEASKYIKEHKIEY
jgi:hypothetical protein